MTRSSQMAKLPTIVIHKRNLVFTGISQNFNLRFSQFRIFVHSQKLNELQTIIARRFPDGLHRPHRIRHRRAGGASLSQIRTLRSRPVRGCSS